MSTGVVAANAWISGTSFLAYIDGGGSTELVVLNGVESPLLGSGGHSAAKSELEELLPEGTSLTLTPDTTLTNSGGSKLFWVDKSGINVSVQMCTLGYARYQGREKDKVTSVGVTATDFYSNDLYTAEVKAATDAAELALTGLWGSHWKNPFEFKASTPDDGATEVPIDTAITINLTHSIDQDSLYKTAAYKTAEDSFLVKMYDTNMTAVAITTSTLANVITVTPLVPLNADYKYVVRVLGADRSPTPIKNVDGDNLTRSVNIFFTTGSTLTIDITSDEADAKGSTIYKSIPIIQRPLEVHATTPEQFATHQATFPTIDIQFNEKLIGSGTYEYTGGGTVVEAFSAGVFDYGLTTHAVTQAIYQDNLRLTFTGTPADNTRYVVRISPDIKSDSGALMEKEFEYKFSGPYDPLWIQAEQVRFELGSLAEGVPADLIHMLIHRNCVDLVNRFSLTTATAEWYHKDYVALKTQRDLLETLAMSLDAGVSVQMGVGFSERRGDRLPEAIAARTSRVSKDIHAIVNTHFYDTHAALTRSMVLANSLLDGSLDEVSKNRFYPRPDPVTARMGGTRVSTGRASGSGAGTMRQQNWLNMVMTTYMTVTPA